MNKKKNPFLDKERLIERGIGPIPLPQQNDLGLERGEWTYCLDCFEILQDGRPTGRKVSTLRAP